MLLIPYKTMLDSSHVKFVFYSFSNLHITMHLKEMQFILRLCYKILRKNVSTAIFNLIKITECVGLGLESVFLFQ